MECFLFAELRIFSLSSSLFAWFSSTPFLSFVFYLFFCWIFAVVLVCCLGIRFQKWLLDFIYHDILHQLLRSHPPQVTSSRARPPLVKGVGHIGRLFSDFRGWPLWFMTSIAFFLGCGEKVGLKSPKLHTHR